MADLIYFYRFFVRLVHKDQEEENASSLKDEAEGFEKSLLP